MSADTWATIADLGTALGTLVLALATFSAVRSGNRTARAAEQSLLTSLRPLLMPSRLSDEPLKVNFGDNKWVRVPGGSAVAEIGGGDGRLGPRDSVIYFSVSLRNVGNGIAVLHGWRLITNSAPQPNEPMPPLDEFVMQTRDMYIPVGDIGFWQGAIRDLADPRYPDARKTVENRGDWMVDLLYGDQEGGQRAISRFRCQPRPWPARPRDDGSPPGLGASEPGAGEPGASGPGASGPGASGPGSSGPGASGPGASGPGASGPGSSGRSDDGHGDDDLWLATVARHWTIDQPDPRSADRPE